MKSSIITIGFCFVFSFVLGQDSLKIETVQDTFSTPHYVSEEDQFFVRKMPQKWIGVFALDVVTNPYISENKIHYIYERKLNKSFSIATNLGIESKIYREDTKLAKLDRRLVQRSTSEVKLIAAVEPRWYFDAHKKAVDNLNGAYFGLRFSTVNYPKTEDWYTNTNLSNTYSTELTYGFQSSFMPKNNLMFSSFRFQSLGFVNVNIGAGAEFNIATRWHPTFKLGVQWGLSRMRKADVDKYNSPNNMCGIFNCFVEEKSMLRINLLNMVKNLSEKGFSGELNVAYERLLGNSALSLGVESSLQLTQNWGDDNPYQNHNNSIFSISIEPRHYFRQKREIAQGISARNLNGAFAGLQMGYRIAQNYNVFNEKTFTESFFTDFVVGTQNRIFGNIYAAAKLGVGCYIANDNPTKEFKDVKAEFVFDYKIGVAF